MSPVPGGADLERNNQYWIDLGASRERERILELLEKHMCLYLYGFVECGGTSSTCIGKKELGNQAILALIKGENK